MAVLIIFPVILQTDINVIMLSIGGQGAYISDQTPPTTTSLPLLWMTMWLKKHPICKTVYTRIEAQQFGAKFCPESQTVDLYVGPKNIFRKLMSSTVPIMEKVLMMGAVANPY